MGTHKSHCDFVSLCSEVRIDAKARAVGNDDGVLWWRIWSVTTAGSLCWDISDLHLIPQPCATREYVVSVCVGCMMHELEVPSYLSGFGQKMYSCG